uniref:VQ domain-containing protein n=1 Tax=Opuntia streptacantha TaxID=393608 RepID=A0A7C8ZX93_OPUST
MSTTTTTKTPKPAPKKAVTTKRGGGGRPKSRKSNTAAVNSARERGLKVVHISNPMRVEVSPAEFRSLVQELTGRHALEWPDHPRWRNATTTTDPSLSGFALDNISNDHQVPAPAGGGTATLEAENEEEEEELHQDFDLLGFDQPAISCSFGSDPSYDHDDHEMLYMGNDFISGFMCE